MILDPVVLMLTGAALCAVMAVGWLHQRLSRNIGWVDVYWTFGVAGAGVATALWPPLGDGSPLRRAAVCALVLVWAFRLGLYVAFRVARSDEDGRYVALRQSWGKGLQPRLFGFLQLQAAVSLVLAVAIGLAANRPDPALGLADGLAVAIALAAIGGEALADRQMRAFKADPAHAGQVCDVGLWGWTRHPNYLFEWLGWFAYPVMAIMVSGAYPQGLIALAAPLVMFGVLRFGTGVPPLEAHMLRSRGAAFRAYQTRVPIFLPRRPKVVRPEEVRP